MTNLNARRRHTVRIGGGYVAPGIKPQPPLKPATRRAALLNYTRNKPHLYAFRLPDGIIKIGCSKNVYNRSKQLQGEILAIVPGDFDREQEIHRALTDHVARGREYYHPTAEVLAMVNKMRDYFNLPHLAA